MIVAVFGKPGSGKSTAAARFIRINNKKKLKYYHKLEKSKLYKKLQSKNTKISNYLINLLYKKNFYDVIYSTDPTFKNTVPIDFENLGKWKPTWNSCLILEEAGIGLNSRNYAKLTVESKRLAAMHRHSGCDILLISQSSDFDKAYRQRSEVMFIAKKIGPFTWYHRIPYDITVDEEKHDIVEGYFNLPKLIDVFETLFSLKRKHRLAKFPFTRSHIVYRPIYYKDFDSYVDDYDYPQVAPDVLLEQKKKEIIVESTETKIPVLEAPTPSQDDKKEETFEDIFNEFF